jgi:hypothetical protein
MGQSRRSRGIGTSSRETRAEQGEERDGSDGTRTRDLRRDRPVMALQGSAGIGGDSRREQGLSTLAFRGLAGVGDGLREPRAGSARDAALPRERTLRRNARNPIVAHLRITKLGASERAVDPLLTCRSRPGRDEQRSAPTLDVHPRGRRRWPRTRDHDPRGSCERRYASWRTVLDVLDVAASAVTAARDPRPAWFS